MNYDKQKLGQQIKSVFDAFRSEPEYDFYIEKVFRVFHTEEDLEWDLDGHVDRYEIKLALDVPSVWLSVRKDGGYWAWAEDEYGYRIVETGGEHQVAAEMFAYYSEF